MIDSQLGKEIEQGKIETLKKEDLIVLNDIIDKDRCLNCGSAINDHYAYCPYCGKPLV
jgi:uncharacterized OB-fold protein